MPVHPRPGEGARVHAELSAEVDGLAKSYGNLTLGHSLVTTLADDIAEACETLKVKGGLHEVDRRRAKTGVGY